jgi:type II secretory pathway component GspD/PulD (secretin)
MSVTTRIIILNILLLLSSSPLIAATSIHPQDQVKVNVDFENTPLQDVVNFVSVFTGKSFMSQDFSTHITWIQNDIPKYDMIKYFEGILNINGIFMHYNKDGYYVLKTNAQVTPNSKSFFSFKLRHQKAEDVADALQKIFGAQIIIDSVKDTSTLIVSGPFSLLSSLTSIINDIDRFFPEIRNYPAKHITVKSLYAHFAGLSLFETPCIKDFWNKQLVCKGSAKEHLNAGFALAKFDLANPSQVQIEKIFYLHTVKSADALIVLNSRDFNLTMRGIDDNKIYLAGLAADISKATHTLDLIDGYAAQIRIEAVVASLNDTAFADLGLQLHEIGSKGFLHMGALAFQEAAAFAPSFLLKFLSGTTTLDVSASKGTYKGELLSSPSLTVLNGQTGSIHVGQNIPFVTSTTENTSGSRTTSIERADIGVKLTITPRIEGDFINLKIDQEVSSLSPDSRGAADIVTEIQKITSSLLLADGETIFLGGVRSQVNVNQESAVPFLGEIPLLGAVFRYTNDQNEERNLIISLKPTIIQRKI